MEYDWHYRDFVSRGLIDTTKTTWEGFGTTTIVMSVVFATQADLLNFISETSYLKEERDALLTNLGWSLSVETLN